MQTINTIGFVAGFMLLACGIASLMYSHDTYITGAGFVIWGVGSLWQAWARQKGMKDTLPSVIYLIGCLISIIGTIIYWK